MQPVSMIMSNMNVEAMTHHAPNALAAAQDTGQSQEIIREGIQVTQRVQASEAAAEMQRVHRKTENDQREGRQGKGNPRDSFVKSEQEGNGQSESNNAPLMRENVRVKKHVSFTA
ncbi:MAG: hypothetical protein IJQ58_09945 [Synergistaceae bacterium]|nr:hypothetical protein [Synergistaceae bacterium]